MLDTGGHMALIKGLSFTPDGMQLVSAGDDKVIRVWDWRAGKIVRTIRGQVAPVAKVRFTPWRCRLTGAGWP
jgi:WD40 repeat protein